MNAPLMECSPYLEGYFHEIELRIGEDMDRGHNLRLRKLPDVQFMDILYALNVSDRSIDFLEGDTARDTLQQNEGRAFDWRGEE